MARMNQLRLACNEPTSAIEAKMGQAGMTLIRRLALCPEYATIVVTHDPRVFGFAGRIVSMEDGTISYEKRVQAPDSSNQVEPLGIVALTQPVPASRVGSDPVVVCVWLRRVLAKNADVLIRHEMRWWCGSSRSELPSPLR